MAAQSTWYLQTPDDGLQFLKEEKTENAIYAIYLKKIRYHSSIRPRKSMRLQEANSTFYMQPLGGQAGGQHRWQLVEIKSIKFATIQVLVRKLGSGCGDIDMSYVSTFLTTYRTFATSQLVLDLIIDSYTNCCNIVEQDEQEFYQRTLKLVLSIWVEKYEEDFIEPPSYSLLNQLLVFALDVAKDVDLANKVSNKLSLLSNEKSVDKEDFVAELLYPLSICFLDYQLDSISSRHFAEQLTLIDADLFKKVVPHQCLGSSWSRRHDPEGVVKVRSVMATIDQFNRLTNRALADILQPIRISKTQRASIIERWISIAQELRSLKNFSSLKAIISALQSNSVFRLKAVWSKLNKEAMLSFQELSEMLSEENNHNLLRQILYREGTSKYAETKKHRRTQSWMCGNFKDTIAPTNQPSVGTIPYLGTFLTDLTMLDAAFPNHHEEDDRLINFEKKRKEYEILTQIKLLQSAAGLYSMRRDEAFNRAFNVMPIFSDNESYEYSCKIEAEIRKFETLPTKRKHSNSNSRKSISSFFEKLASSSSSHHDNQSSFSEGENPDKLSLHSLQGSIPSSNKSQRRLSLYSNPTKYQVENLVIRVHMVDTDSTNNYKSIMVTKDDTIRDAITKALKKYDLKQDPDLYDMLYILPCGLEISLVPESCLFETCNPLNRIIDVLLRQRMENHRTFNSHHLPLSSVVF